MAAWVNAVSKEPPTLLRPRVVSDKRYVMRGEIRITTPAHNIQNDVAHQDDNQCAPSCWLNFIWRNI